MICILATLSLTGQPDGTGFIFIIDLKHLCDRDLWKFIKNIIKNNKKKKKLSQFDQVP